MREPESKWYKSRKEFRVFEKNQSLVLTSLKQTSLLLGLTQPFVPQLISTVLFWGKKLFFLITLTPNCMILYPSCIQHQVLIPDSPTILKLPSFSSSKPRQGLKTYFSSQELACCEKGAENCQCPCLLDGKDSLKKFDNSKQLMQILLLN